MPKGRVVSDDSEALGFPRGRAIAFPFRIPGLSGFCKNKQNRRNDWWKKTKNNRNIRSPKEMGRRACSSMSRRDCRPPAAPANRRKGRKVDGHKPIRSGFFFFLEN